MLERFLWMKGYRGLGLELEFRVMFRCVFVL